MAVPEAYVTILGLEGDYNLFRAEKRQNKPEWAVSLMPLEMLVQLQKEGWPVQPGEMGENITTVGIPYDSFAVGQRYQAGFSIIEISEPCTPCRTLGELDAVDDDVAFMKALSYTTGERKNRRGWYARVIREGSVRKGDSFILLD